MARRPDKKVRNEAASEGLDKPLAFVQGVLESTGDLLRSVLDSTADGILVVGIDGRIVAYNQQFATMWRLPPEVLASRDDDRALECAVRLLRDPEAFLQQVRHLYDHAEEESYDVIELIDGRTFERYSRPYYFSGAIEGRVWSFRDVTQQRHTEARLQLSERYFRSLTENARDLIAIVAEDGSIRYASPSHEAVLGHPPIELVGTGVRSWIHPDDVERATELFVAAVDGDREMPHNEFRIRHRDGSWRTLESIGTNLVDEPGIEGIVVNSRDVTERKHAEMKTETLLAIARDIGGTLDLAEMLRRVQRRAAEALPSDAFAVLFDEGETATLRIMSHHGIPEALGGLLDGFTLPRPGPAFTDRTARGETLVLEDFDTRPWLPVEMHAVAASSSLIVAPFNVWNRHFGVLVAANFGTGRAFDAKQAELCAGIAQQLAVAIEAVELYRAQREEAEVAGALARFGRELIAWVNEPSFLDRLCELTASLLGCDVSYTMLRRPEEEVYVPLAGYGDSPEEEQLTRLLAVPREMLGWLLERLEQDDVADVESIPDGILPVERQRRYRPASAICMALRRGAEIIGMQVAYRRGGEHFTDTQRRIARGLAQFASLALDHARLVEELEQANRVRSEFVATVSHELRTPLNIILGYGDLLLTETFGKLNGEQQDTLERIDRRAHELLELVNSTLEASRLERGQVLLDVRSTSIARLIAQVSTETQELQQRSGVAVVCEIAAGTPEILTDPAKLKVVLKNLIGNALKFTDRGTVTVRVAPRRGGVGIDVADTGIGIAPEAVPVIFQAFRQAASSATRLHGGVGLGLFIVARFVELLKGRIAVDSELGRGSTFELDFPLDVRRGADAEQRTTV